MLLVLQRSISILQDNGNTTAVRKNILKVLLSNKEDSSGSGYTVAMVRKCQAVAYLLVV